jgi:similar to spore coat protein
MDTAFGIHETLELHEISVFKTVCLTKSKSLQALVSDNDLKNILQQDVQLSSRQIQELQGLMSAVNR